MHAAPFAFKAARPAPDLALRQAPSFVLAEGVGGAAEAACLPGGFGEDLLAEGVQQVLAAAELDPQIAIVLTSSPLSCGSLFYLPLANDVRGIGYQHEDAREVFDDSADSTLEGIAFLNDWPYWRERPDEFETALLHEVGHRWGARVHAEIDGIDSDELLGRQRKHWSYFAETAGSPLEGNRFEHLGDERYQASTPLGTSAFSQLDLYLMGLVPPEDVAPFGLLRADAMTLRDCKDALLSEVSPPQFCEPLDFTAERIEVAIEDIIAVEGPREPVADMSVQVVDVAVIVLSSDRDVPMLREDCTALSESLDEHIDAFELATGGRMRLASLTRSSDARCASWPVMGTPPPSMSAMPSVPPSCATRPGARSSWSAAFMLIGFILRRRRRAS